MSEIATLNLRSIEYDFKELCCDIDETASHFGGHLGFICHTMLRTRTASIQNSLQSTDHRFSIFHEEVSKVASRLVLWVSLAAPSQFHH